MTATAKTTKEKVAPQKSAAKASPKKTLPKLADDVQLLVRSNQYGVLGFTNSRTGETTIWSGVDDVQVITVGDIRNMRTSAPTFLAEPWIWIDSIYLDECDDLTEEEIYTALGIAKFYKQAKRPKYLSEVYKWDAAQIKAAVPGMTRNTKQAVALALNQAIRDQLLVSLPLMKTWEQELGLELDKG